MFFINLALQQMFRCVPFNKSISAEVEGQPQGLSTRLRKLVMQLTTELFEVSVRFPQEYKQPRYA
jgi:hypothetical protein